MNPSPFDKFKLRIKVGGENYEKRRYEYKKGEG
jgi:hypothetical protein